MTSLCDSLVLAFVRHFPKSGVLRDRTRCFTAMDRGSATYLVSPPPVRRQRYFDNASRSLSPSWQVSAGRDRDLLLTNASKAISLRPANFDFCKQYAMMNEWAVVHKSEAVSGLC